MKTNQLSSKHAMELLKFSLVLSPQKAFISFRIREFCLNKFYPQDFTYYDKQVLENELKHYELNVVKDLEFKKFKSIFELWE